MAEAWAINADGGSPEYNAAELRRIQAQGLWHGSSDRMGAREGVRPTGQGVISVSGTDWTQHDLTAVVYPGLTSTSGPYLVEKVEETGSLDPADGSNDRIDALDLQVQDDDEDASGERRVRVVYVAGTPASSPSEPSLTSNSLRLGTYDVPAGGSPSPSVRSQAQWTVAVGGIVPLRDGESMPSNVGEGAYADADDALWRYSGSEWQAVASPSSPTVEVFESDGTFTKGDYPWASRVWVRLVGGGGGGGGCGSTGSGEAAAAAGGGGGGYAEKVVPIGDLGTTEAVTVGTGGSGGAAGQNDGNGGGTSSFGSHLEATGGSSGQGDGSGSGDVTRSGGTGGDGSNGDLAIVGSDGINSMRISGEVGAQGHGGASHLGGAQRASSITDGGDGLNGQAHGVGGSGGYNRVSQGSDRSGGDGSNGVVIVMVF